MSSSTQLPAGYASLPVGNAAVPGASSSWLSPAADRVPSPLLATPAAPAPPQQPLSKRNLAMSPAFAFAAPAAAEEPLAAVETQRDTNAALEAYRQKRQALAAAAVASSGTSEAVRGVRSTTTPARGGGGAGTAPSAQRPRAERSSSAAPAMRSVRGGVSLKRDADPAVQVAPSASRKSLRAGVGGRRGSVMSAQGSGGSNTSPGRDEHHAGTNGEGERAWRLGRPGRGSSRQRGRPQAVLHDRAAHRDDDDEAAGGGGFRPWREPASSQDGASRHRGAQSEPFVQVFVSPRAGTGQVAAPAQDPLPVPVPRRASSATATSAVSSSISSARALLSDISRLLGHDQSPVAAPAAPLALTAPTLPAPPGERGLQGSAREGPHGAFPRSLPDKDPYGVQASSIAPLTDPPTVGRSAAADGTSSCSLVRSLAAYDAAFDADVRSPPSRPSLAPAPAVGSSRFNAASDGPSGGAPAALAESARLRLCMRLLQLSDMVRAYDRELLRLLPGAVAAAAEASAPPLPPAAAAPAAAALSPLGSLLPAPLEHVFATVVSAGPTTRGGSGSVDAASFRGFGAAELRAQLVPGQRGTLAYLWANRKDAVAEWELIRSQLGVAAMAEPAAAARPALGGGEPPLLLLAGGPGLRSPQAHPSPSLLRPAYGTTDGLRARSAAPSFAEEPWAASAAGLASAGRNEEGRSAVAAAAGPDLAALLDRAESLVSPAQQQPQEQQQELRWGAEPAAASAAPYGSGGGEPLQQLQQLPEYEPPQPAAWDGMPSPPHHLRFGGQEPQGQGHGLGLSVSDLQHGGGGGGLPLGESAAVAPEWRAQPPPPPQQQQQQQSTTTIYLSAAARPVPQGRPSAVPALSPWLGAGSESSSGSAPAKPAPTRATASIPPQQQLSHLPPPPPQVWGVSERAGSSVYVLASRAAAARSQARAQPQQQLQMREPRIIAQERMLDEWVPQGQYDAAAAAAAAAPKAAALTPAVDARSGRPQPLAQAQSRNSGGGRSAVSTRDSAPAPLALKYGWQPSPLGASLQSAAPGLSDDRLARERAPAPSARPLYVAPQPAPQVVPAPPPHAPASTLSGNETDRARPKRPQACAGEGIYVEAAATETAEAAVAALNAFHATFRAVEEEQRRRGSVASVGRSAAQRGMTLTELAAL